MKQLFTFLFTVVTTFSFSQNATQTEYLVVYGQVWGFLKYFHPEPSNLDWDQVLIDDFESVKNCSSDTELNTILDKLIGRCPDYTPKSRAVADSMKFNESYEWLENKTVSAKNRAYLDQLLKNKPEFKNKYIDGTMAGNPKITAENEFEAYKIDPAIHYLALTRYWNVINYYFPCRDLIPDNWTSVYHEHLPTFLSTDSYDDYYFAVRRVTSEIRDGHGFILTGNNPMDEYNLAPFFCENVSDGMYITHIWQDSLQSLNLKYMDKIVAINGKSTDEKWKEIGEYVSYSNDYYLSKSTYYLRITPDDSMTISIERDGKLFTETYPTIDRSTLKDRYNAKKKKEDEPGAYGFITDSISGKTYCYIHMGRLKSTEITRKFVRSLYKVDHVIIDVRNYPNWTMPKLSKALIKGKRKFAKFIKMDFDYPGSYTWTESQTIGNNRKQYDGQIYILVDYNTMSQAEYTVMALQQHPNTTTIGGQTAGADGNITKIPLPFGIKSVFSGLGVYYPDGRQTQQVGVERDIEVVQDSTSLVEKRDLIMEKALELIRE